jgi:hypothetical protein
LPPFAKGGQGGLILDKLKNKKGTDWKMEASCSKAVLHGDVIFVIYCPPFPKEIAVHFPASQRGKGLIEKRERSLF